MLKKITKAFALDPKVYDEIKLSAMGTDRSISWMVNKILKDWAQAKRKRLQIKPF